MKYIVQKIAPIFMILSCITFLLGCDSLFFYPDKTLYYHSQLISTKPSDAVFVSYDDTKLHGWFFSPDMEPVKGYIFFLHGNASNISTHTIPILWLVQKGYRLFTFDYRGFGLSEGKPDVKSVTDDSLAAFDYMISSMPSDAKVIIYGQSLGGAMAIDVAALTTHQDRIVAVVTDSAFSSWRTMAREAAGKFMVTWLFQYPISWFYSDEYSPITLERKIPADIPLVHIHNRDDEVVYSTHSEKLYQIGGNRSKLWLTNYHGHITAMLSPEFRDDFLSCIENLPDTNNCREIKD